MKAVSSSGFGDPDTWNSARSAVISSPVTKHARWWAWVPMSPVVKAAPTFARSSRHASASSIAHSWKYSTWTCRTAPSAPSATICRACRTMAWPAKE